MATRLKPNEDDVLAYSDEDYLIFRKNGSVLGTLDTPHALLNIAVNGLSSQDSPLLLRKKDYAEIINKEIARLNKTIENYPEDK